MSAILVAALLVCAGFGGAWALASNDEGIQRAAIRDDALEGGRKAVAAFNSMDHRDVKGGLDRWEANATGALREEVRNGREPFVQQIQQAKTISNAEVLDAGITELDDAGNKATMLAVVEMTVQAEDQQPSAKRHRYQAVLTREGEDWKLSRLGLVPVG
ncbi:hypothetical protein IQ251_10955 [Saccharopolyspora sp. HNM0983]|uniref:Mce-associated membrane protein n=1 Tax=Saccharopolyspora montiporae TaxID=2781240 RepID=A0A929BC73_9PSEU|nr:hypothetical protein [Saccharopolyspora sp. HNM0983]